MKDLEYTERFSRKAKKQFRTIQAKDGTSVVTSYGTSIIHCGNSTVEADIISEKYAKRRSVIHKSSSKIVFSDNSNLYKTDRITNNYTFKTEKLTYYVREIVTEWGGNTSHTFMCYAA